MLESVSAPASACVWVCLCTSLIVLFPLLFQNLTVPKAKKQNIIQHVTQQKRYHLTFWPGRGTYSVFPQALWNRSNVLIKIYSFIFKFWHKTNFVICHNESCIKKYIIVTYYCYLCNYLGVFMCLCIDVCTFVFVCWSCVFSMIKAVVDLAECSGIRVPCYKNNDAIWQANFFSTDSCLVPTDMGTRQLSVHACLHITWWF